jgi:dihydrolipoamide dehydrogenase
LYNGALHGKGFGVHVENISIDHEKVMKRKKKTVTMLVMGVRSKLKSKNVTVVESRAEITGKTADGFTVRVKGDGSSDNADSNDVYIAGKLLIAAGSTAIVPPIPGVKEGIESGLVLTSREILEIQTVPKKLAIVGGGVIGLEMADYFATAGSEVVIVEMLDKIAGTFDTEISAILQKNLKAKGIAFRLGSKVTGITADGITVEKQAPPQEGQNSEPAPAELIEADAVLLSIGRRPATEGFGLETIGVQIEKGAVVTDDHMLTTVPNVYAAGDINGKFMLAHTAYREAEVAVNHMLGQTDAMRYNAIPSVIYTYPEVASVGETAETAAEKGLPVRVKSILMNYSGRYAAENERGNGICKMIVAKGTNQVIGLQLIGSYASEIILSAGMIVDSGLPMKALEKIVFPHPTVGEIVREALFVE